MAEDGVTGAGRAVGFGPFQLYPAEQLLREGDSQVALGNRAMEILIALVERAGELVSKEALIARVWPNTFVDETNLRVNVASLRRILRDGQNGNRYIVTDAGRGYRFVAPLSVLGEKALPTMVAAPPRIDNLPGTLTRVIGREATIATLSAQLPERRFITLVGPGGIGKTTIAVAVARELAASYPDGVAFLDLAPITDPGLLASTCATVLGLSISADDRLPGLLAHLRNRQMLLVFDSCEHVIEAAAALAEEVSVGAAGVHILATSREPLRAAGERVHRILPLESPAASAGLTAAEALTFSGVELFVERARAANLDSFELREADAPPVAEICRRLDGIALAIELAAGRVATFGARELADRLDDRFRLLTGGRRTALPRHQTLSATLDWSYELLPADEQSLLRWLAVFSGEFSLASAVTVAANDDASQAIGIANLVAKSLVAFDHRGDVGQYRLLDSTRLYALAKLRDSGELPEASRRHAEHFRDLLAEAEAETERRLPTEWLAIYARHIDNVRAALNWAVSPDGDPIIGVALTIAAVPLWVQLSLMGECRNWVERALAALDRMTAPDRRQEMVLRMALANAVLGTVGTIDAVGTAWNRALELAEELDDIDQKLRALYGLYFYQMRIGDYRSGLAFARRFRAAAEQKGDPPDLLMGDRIVGVSLFWIGDPGGGRAQIEHMLARTSAVRSRLQPVRFGVDQRVAGLFHLARILWVQGYPDQAVRTAVAAVDEAVAIDHATSLCFALADGACPVSAWVGDMVGTARFSTMLSERAEKLGLGLWHAYSLAWRGWLADRQGDSEAAVTLVNGAIAEFRATQFDLHFTTFLGYFAEILARAGREADGMATIGEAVERAERTGEGWCFPELLRIQGDITWRLGGADGIEAAVELYERAFDAARRQGSLSWELRIAISLARLRMDQGRRAEGREVLQAVFSRFTEGFGSADIGVARELLAELR